MLNAQKNSQPPDGGNSFRVESADRRRGAVARRAGLGNSTRTSRLMSEFLFSDCTWRVTDSAWESSTTLQAKATLAKRHWSFTSPAE
jgi:hypothetical protein